MRYQPQLQNRCPTIVHVSGPISKTAQTTEISKHQKTPFKEMNIPLLLQ
jgi:hypothetical protein